MTKAVDPGLQKILEEEIVPRLLSDVPGQPTPEELAADPTRHRFTLIFDREGYSPSLFARLKAQRIAILTYHKHPGPDWEQSEFTPHVRMSEDEDFFCAKGEKSCQSRAPRLEFGSYETPRLELRPMRSFRSW